MGVLTCLPTILELVFFVFVLGLAVLAIMHSQYGRYMRWVTFMVGGVCPQFTSENEEQNQMMRYMESGNKQGLDQLMLCHALRTHYTICRTDSPDKNRYFAECAPAMEKAIMAYWAEAVVKENKKFLFQDVLTRGMDARMKQDLAKYMEQVTDHAILDTTQSGVPDPYTPIPAINHFTSLRVLPGKSAEMSFLQGQIRDAKQGMVLQTGMTTDDIHTLIEKEKNRAQQYYEK